METQLIKFGGIGDHGVGDIWATTRYGVFVVVKVELARWRGEDRDVYAHVDYWYTIRPANEAEQALWQAAVDAATARQELRKQLGAEPSHTFDASKRQLRSEQRMLDSYDDRWQPPGNIDLDDEAYAIEQDYLDALERLHGHAQEVA